MNMTGNAIALSSICKGIKSRPRTNLFEEFETYLIHSKVKTASPLICLIDMDLSDF